MRFGHRRNIPIWIQGLIVIIGIAVISALFIYEKVEEERMEQHVLQMGKEDRKKLIPSDENSINVLQDNGFVTDVPEQGKLVLSSETFRENYERTSRFDVAATSVSVDLSKQSFDASKIYLLRFRMKAEENAAIVNVNFGKKYNFFITTEWNEYYYPCTDEEIASVKWVLESDFQIIQISDVEIYEYGANADLQSMPCGTYLADAKEIKLSEDTDLNIGHQNRDIQYLNGYVYLVGDSSLIIAKENADGSLVTCGYLSDLGEVRRLELYDDTMLAVASRHNGVYLVDISNKETPTVISHYNTLEIANDVCFASDYMIVAGRYFGVEIVDIKDRSNPQFVSKISNNKECYRVAVSDTTLFVSCWATGEVELYDISVVDNPQKIRTVEVDGRVGETFVDEDFMYVVTGYSGMSLKDTVGQPGYGTGNGLTIFDITDITRPVLVSTVKADGSLFHSAYDDWSVCVNNGFAYFTNSYGGLYVYDVSNPAAPERIGKYTVPLYKDKSSLYTDMTESDAYVFPYDCSEYINSPVTGVALGEGKVYFSCAYTSLHSIDFLEAMPLEKKVNNSVEYQVANASDKNRYRNVEYLLSDENVYVIQKAGDYYYVGTDVGIYVLDSKFERIKLQKTDNPVQDIKIVDGILFTAETTGMGIYRVDDEIIEFISWYDSNSKNKNVSSLGVTPDKAFAVLQASFAGLEVVSITDLENPSKVDNLLTDDGNKISVDKLGTGSLYYRNIVNGNVNGMIGVIGMANSVWLRSTGENLQLVASYRNSLYREEGGTASMTDGTVVTIANNGYRVYDPIADMNSDLSNLNVNKVSDVFISGKATVSDGLLVVCNAYKGEIWVINIANPENPVLVSNFEISGNPDLCLVTENYILIPVKHSGLMKITRSAK